MAYYLDAIKRVNAVLADLVPRDIVTRGTIGKGTGYRLKTL